jgi:monovalent cation:H+ antiporter-2, CPA2 family
MDSLALIHDFCLIALLAGAFGYACKCINLSPILGFLSAGVLLGYNLPFLTLQAEAQVGILTQIGLVFIMFCLGLTLSLSKLRQLGISTLIGTIISSLLILHVIQGIGMLVGWTHLQSLFTAALFMVSSSAVIAKSLQSMQLTHARSGQIALGVTINEDIVAIVMLAVLTSQVQASALSPSLSGLLTSLTVFVVLIILAGLSLVPRLLRWLDSQHTDDELQTLFLCGLLFLLAWLSVIAGYSLALGAFLIGAIVAELPQKLKISSAFSGLKDLFGAIFFVGIGMQIHLSDLGDSVIPILLLSLLVLVLRPLATCIGFTIVGVQPSTAKQAALFLIPLGEFSFVIAQMGVNANILPQSFYSVAVGVCLITIISGPLIAHNNKHILNFLDKLTPNKAFWLTEGYYKWVNSFTWHRQPTWRVLKPQMLRIATEAFACACLVSAAPAVFKLLYPHIPTQVSNLFSAVYILLSCGVLSVLIAALWRNIDAFLLLLADCITLPEKARNMVPKLSQLLASVVVFYSLWLFLPTDLRIYGVLLFLLAGLSLAIFSRQVIYLYSHWNLSVRSTFSATKGPKASRPFQEGSSLHLADFILEENSKWCGKTLKELTIPERFNCSIVEITRQSTPVLTLDGNTQLFAYDQLTVLGTVDNLSKVEEATKETIETPLTPQALTLETVVFPGVLTRVSYKELAELAKTNFSIQLVASPTQSFKSKDIVPAGTELLLLGRHLDINSFKTYLGTQNLS